MITQTGSSRRGQEGSALLLALIVMCLLGALGLAAVTAASVERGMSANQVSGLAVHYAAEAIASRVVAELGSIDDWTDLPGGSITSAFLDSSAEPQTPWRQPIDLTQLTRALQDETDSALPLGVNRPTWRLFSSGSLHRLLFGSDDWTGPYCVVWIADDPAESDGNSAIDSNGRIAIHAAAIAMKGSRHDLDLTVEHQSGATPATRVLTWRDGS
jgi:hypothetical protein